MTISVTTPTSLQGGTVSPAQIQSVVEALVADGTIAAYDDSALTNAVKSFVASPGDIIPNNQTRLIGGRQWLNETGSSITVPGSTSITALTGVGLQDVTDKGTALGGNFTTVSFTPTTGTASGLYRRIVLGELTEFWFSDGVNVEMIAKTQVTPTPYAVPLATWQAWADPANPTQAELQAAYEVAEASAKERTIGDILVLFGDSDSRIFIRYDGQYGTDVWQAGGAAGAAGVLQMINEQRDSKFILDPSNTQNVAPTAAQYSAPTADDVARKVLPDGVEETWSHDGTSWTRQFVFDPNVGSGSATYTIVGRSIADLGTPIAFADIPTAQLIAGVTAFQAGDVIDIEYDDDPATEERQFTQDGTLVQVLDTDIPGGGLFDGDGTDVEMLASTLPEGSDWYLHNSTDATVWPNGVYVKEPILGWVQSPKYGIGIEGQQGLTGLTGATGPAGLDAQMIASPWTTLAQSPAITTDGDISNRFRLDIAAGSVPFLEVNDNAIQHNATLIKVRGHATNTFGLTAIMKLVPGETLVQQTDPSLATLLTIISTPDAVGSGVEHLVYVDSGIAW